MHAIPTVDPGGAARLHIQAFATETNSIVLILHVVGDAHTGAGALQMISSDGNFS